MTCRELTELLLDYVGGDLSEEMCTTIRSHLAACEHCVHFVETYRVTIQISRTLPASVPPESILERLRKSLEDR